MEKIYWLLIALIIDLIILFCLSLRILKSLEKSPSQDNQTLYSKGSNHTYNEPNNTRLCESFDNPVDQNTTQDKNHKPDKIHTNII
jgi:hypothetical protein